MSERDEEIHRDLYSRMNETDRKLSNLIGQNSIIVEQNKQLIDLLKSALKYMFVIIVILILALIYGAIGKDGFNAVKGVQTAVLANDNGDSGEIPDGQGCDGAGHDRVPVSSDNGADVLESFMRGIHYTA